jgi:adenine-specific DNA-methyltransferase
MNIDNLGQVFTPNNIVKRMLNLIKNGKDILEPSSGNGSFTNKLKNENLTCIEIDKRICTPNCMNMNFFNYNTAYKHDTIIGNPPYVAYKNITNETKKKLNMDMFDKRSNLYLFFILKSFYHLKDNGEIIFITPVEFLKSTSSIKLNNLLYENGTITDYYEYIDTKIFNGASPNVAIWRYEKDNFTRKTNTNKGIKTFQNINGQLIFSNYKLNIKLSDYFFVKIGGESGLNEIFENENGNKEFVCSYTHKTGKLKRMFYNVENDYLMKYKDLLLNRKIKKFDESNWYMWGRNTYESDEERFYVNCKTRNNNPFFYNDCKYFDGSILGIFPKINVDIKKCVNIFNKIDWDELGFKQGDRFIFNQKSLENIMLPSFVLDELF